jgi:hypothetical protein
MDVLEKCIGPPLHDSFVNILGSPEVADVALGLYRKRFGNIGMYENRLYAGAQQYRIFRGKRALCGKEIPRLISLIPHLGQRLALQADIPS